MWVGIRGAPVLCPCVCFRRRCERFQSVEKSESSLVMRVCVRVWSGLVGQSMAHIHGPASRTTSGGVLQTLPVGTLQRGCVRGSFST